MRRIICGTFVLAWAIAAPHPAAAWGHEAHRAVAMVAAERLTPQARSRVAAILGPQTMADVSVWADDVRRTTHPETADWHFVNIPLSSQGYVASRDCKAKPAGDCSVAAIPRLLAELRAPGSTPTQRQEALMFLIHIVGDLHQPLHSSNNNDAGGNDRVIADIGGAKNLHAAWDDGVIRASNKTDMALAGDADTWLATQNVAALQAGTPVDWANQAWGLARTVVYPEAQDNVISPAERLQAIQVIDHQIGTAGVRLAALLNQVFGGNATH